MVKEYVSPEVEIIELESDSQILISSRFDMPFWLEDFLEDLNGDF